MNNSDTNAPAQTATTDSGKAKSAEKAQQKPAAQAKPRPAVSTGTSAIVRLFLAIAVLLSLLAAAGSAYLWYLQKTAFNNQAVQLAELKRQLRALDEHPSLIELKQRVLEQQTQLATNLAEQQVKIDALQQAFEITRTTVNRDQRGWVLAEIEYLMRLAITRLQLTYDVQGAVQALIIADQRLNDLAEPAFLSVRKMLSAEITALKSLQQPDINGAALQLMSISNRLHLLPQAKRPAIDLSQTPTDAPLAQLPFWEHSWNRFKSMIGLHRRDAPRTASSIQAELYYVEQLLRFELEAARQAVLRLDKDDFDRRIKNARQLLDAHYERGNEQVIRIRAELALLEKSKLFPALPDISGSLYELHKLRSKYPSPGDSAS